MSAPNIPWASDCTLELARIYHDAQVYTGCLLFLYVITFRALRSETLLQNGLNRIWGSTVHIFLRAKVKGVRVNSDLIGAGTGQDAWQTDCQRDPSFRQDFFFELSCACMKA